LKRISLGSHFNKQGAERCKKYTSQERTPAIPGRDRSGDAGLPENRPTPTAARNGMAVAGPSGFPADLQAGRPRLCVHQAELGFPSDGALSVAAAYVIEELQFCGAALFEPSSQWRETSFREMRGINGMATSVNPAVIASVGTGWGIGGRPIASFRCAPAKWLSRSSP